MDEYEYIEELCEHGKNLCYEEKFEEAILKFEEALKLVSEDIDLYEWLNIAIADCYFILEDYQFAARYFYDAINTCENAEIYLRLGVCLYECNSEEESKHFFMTAYELGGYEVFEKNDKYYTIIEDIIGGNLE